MNKMLAILALGALVAPIAMAHGDDSDLENDGTYVDLDTLGVWSESNGDAGLQVDAQVNAGSLAGCDHSAAVLSHTDDNGTPEDEEDDFEVFDGCLPAGVPSDTREL